MTKGILLSVIFVAVLAFVLVRYGGDRRVRGVRWLRGLVIVGLAPLALQSLVLALFGFGEMASGDLSGAGHLVPLAATVSLAFLAWKRPTEGGVALVLVGLTTMGDFYDATARSIMAAPLLLSGDLLLAAGLGG